MNTLLRITGLHRSDVRQALPLSLAYGLVMAALYVLKPVRNALFLERFGAAGLPWVMLAVAVLGALTATAYGALSRRLSIQRLVSGMFLVLIACLLVFRVLLPLEAAATNYAFYIWVAVYGLVATSLVWQVANMRFNPREARRVFGIIGAAGIVGAIVGGLLTASVSEWLGTDNLVLLAVALVTGAYRCVNQSMRDHAVDERRGKSPKQLGTLGALRRSPLLGWMALTGALIGMVAVVVDVQFNHFVEMSMPTREAKVAFFGRFLAYFNGVAILVQLLLTTRVLSTVGVGPALLTLPLALGLGVTGLWLVPGLLTASLMKIADGALRHSIHKSAFEVLFIPIPTQLKKQAKLFLDATVDSAATGVGALLVLLLTTQLGFDYLQLSWASYALIAVWLVAVWRMRAAYVDTLRRALARRELDTSELTSRFADAGAVDVLLHAIRQGENQRRMAFALEALASVSDPRITAEVGPLLEHRSPRIRVLALKALAAQPFDPTVRGDAEALLGDPNHEVRVEAVRLLAAHDPAGPAEALCGYLEGESLPLRSAALGAIAAEGASEELNLVRPELVEDMLSAPGGEECVSARRHIAKMMGQWPRPELDAYWDRLRNDPDERVVVETIHAAGRTGQARHLPWLFGLLEDRRFRMDARLALARYGDAILDAIVERMDRPDASPRLRRVLPRIVARIDSPRSPRLLLERAARADWAERRPLLEAMGKLRRRFPHLGFDRERVRALLMQEFDTCYFSRMALVALGDASADPGTDPGTDLLRKTLRQRGDESLARVFLLLGLHHAQKDMASAHRGLMRDRPELAASALEFLDNVLDNEEKEALIPLVDEAQAQRVKGVARHRFGIESAGVAELVRDIMSRPDGWLRACALYARRHAALEERRRLATLAAGDRNPIVRETAESLLSGVSQAGAAGA